MRKGGGIRTEDELKTNSRELSNDAAVDSVAAAAAAAAAVVELGSS